MRQKDIRFAVGATTGLAAVAAVGAGLAALLDITHEQWESFAAADRAVVDALHTAIAGNDLAETILDTVTVLGGTLTMWWLIVVGGAALLIRRQPRLAAFAVIAGLGALALSRIVPGSGIALNATVFCGTLYLVLLPAIPERGRGVFAALTVVLIVLTGLATAALTERYASDVVVAWLIGAGWLAVVAFAFERRNPWPTGLDPEAAAALTPVRTAGRRDVGLAAARLAGGWVLIVAVVAGLGRLVVAWTPSFDEAPSQWIAGRRTPELTGWSQFWSDAGNTHMITLGIFIIAPLALAWTLRWRPVVFLPVLLIGEVTLFVTSSMLVGRDRPYVTLLDGHLPTSSFPSGHVAATVCLYAGLAVLVVPRIHGWWRAPFFALAVGMPLLVAAARIYRGAHHPLDVTAGTLLALLWLGVVTFAVRPNADLSAGPALKLPSPALERSTGARAAVVVNPSKLTGGPARRAEIDAAFDRAGWPAPDWLETTVDDPGTGPARQAVAGGAAVVVAAGGDGTVMSCANALVDTGVALAVLPMGTGNLLARNLGLPMRVDDAIAVATADGRRTLDVGVVDGQCFLIMAGMGFDAQMLHDAPAEMKARIGWPAYGLAALRHLCTMPMTVDISLDHGPSFSRRARAILIGNVGRLQGGIRLLPAAVPDDGMLDIAVLMPPRRRNWMVLAWALVRQRSTPPSLEVFRAGHVDVRSDQVQPRELDGDLIAPSDRMTVALRPGALLICVPETAVRTAAPPEPLSVADGPR
jgi:diacylglycerol kinase family enzyme/membrane-associated phospholipid phosphatase